jgi:hypothetical protein
MRRHASCGHTTLYLNGGDAGGNLAKVRLNFFSFAYLRARIAVARVPPVIAATLTVKSCQKRFVGVSITSN